MRRAQAIRQRIEWPAGSSRQAAADDPHEPFQTPPNTVADPMDWQTEEVLGRRSSNSISDQTAHNDTSVPQSSQELQLAELAGLLKPHEGTELQVLSTTTRGDFYDKSLQGELPQL